MYYIVFMKVENKIQFNSIQFKNSIQSLILYCNAGGDRAADNPHCMQGGRARRAVAIIVEGVKAAVYWMDELEKNDIVLKEESMSPMVIVVSFFSSTK